MALRGDDFIGVVYDDGQLRLLKAESKSRQELAKPAITEARKALDRDDGRCRPESLLFVADRKLAVDAVPDEAANSVEFAPLNPVAELAVDYLAVTPAARA